MKIWHYRHNHLWMFLCIFVIIAKMSSYEKLNLEPKWNKIVTYIQIDRALPWINRINIPSTLCNHLFWIKVLLTQIVINVVSKLEYLHDMRRFWWAQVFHFLWQQFANYQCYFDCHQWSQHVQVGKFEQPLTQQDLIETGERCHVCVQTNENYLKITSHSSSKLKDFHTLE